MYDACGQFGPGSQCTDTSTAKLRDVWQFFENTRLKAATAASCLAFVLPIPPYSNDASEVEYLVGVQSAFHTDPERHPIACARAGACTGTG